MSLNYEPSSEQLHNTGARDSRGREGVKPRPVSSFSNLAGLGPGLYREGVVGCGAARVQRNPSKSHDGKGTNGSKNRPHAYPVRCRVPSYYEPCSERVRVGQLKEWQQLKNGSRPRGCSRWQRRTRATQPPPAFGFGFRV